MEHQAARSQFTAGLRGLGLLREWPFLSVDACRQRLEELREAAASQELLSVDVLDLDDGYAAWAETYDEPNSLLEVETPVLAELLDTLPSGSALDVACGTGRVTQLLVDRGHRVIAVDRSAQMIAKARSTAAGAEFHVAEFHSLPLRDCSVDLVTCALALTHAASVVEPVAEMTRVLKGGGHLLLSDIHPCAVELGGHAFFRRVDGARAVVPNIVHWHHDYLDVFSTLRLEVITCREPVYTDEVVRHFVERGGTPDLCNLVGLPFALVWLLQKR